MQHAHRLQPRLNQIRGSECFSCSSGPLLYSVSQSASECCLVVNVAHQCPSQHCSWAVLVTYIGAGENLITTAAAAVVFVLPAGLELLVPMLSKGKDDHGAGGCECQ